jgi:AraC-like DNA-binding protein
VRAYVSRCTLGAGLASGERYNHFPASAACGITWFISGNSQRLHSQQALPSSITFRGPLTRPVTTFNPGPVQMFVLLLMPDALQAMTGVSVGQHLNRLSAADTVFDSQWMSMLHAVAAAADDAARVQLIEAFLAPRWQVHSGGTWGHARSYLPWAQALATRAWAAGTGRSSRQLERRARNWSGLPMRSLRGLCRAEQGFLQALRVASGQAGQRVNWADVALHAGYADQPHLCRELRRFTGFSPQALLRLMHGDEGFWLYRVWR